MTTPQASSRLEMLQARFQQKQLQEKEQKLLQLYDQQQQRAYQVVQRGSAGSNGSNHGSSMSQHTVTKTSSSSHTTSSSQGGKVRQMFDERRQTTVKGIDRSYPLEPLENKPRKQTNGNGTVGQKNGNLTVNRQSVTVKRVARADVNSNLNAGKPIVSYHEEITRKSFGPSVRHREDEDEFGNENRHVSRYSNGNHDDDDHHGVRIEEIIDEDTIERNRMMAKLHLMGYDETLKHRVRNDLESEEFPEDHMVDVPDRLPKRTVAKKQTQAEARLERFKNANARRNNLTKNLTTTAAINKKRSEPMFPAKTTTRDREVVRARIQEVVDKHLDMREKSHELIQSRNSGKSFDGTLSSSDTGKIIAKLQRESPKFFGHKYATNIDYGRTGRSSSRYIRNVKRSTNSPEFFCRESKKLATTYSFKPGSPKIGGIKSPQFSRDIKLRTFSPQFFCKESEKSGTTMRIDPINRRTLSTKLSTDIKRRSASPQFFCRESEKSGTTMSIDTKNRKFPSPESSRKTLRRSSTSPEFFCLESDRSASTMTVTPETVTKFKLKADENTRKSPVFRKSAEPINWRKNIRDSASRLFANESDKIARDMVFDVKDTGIRSPRGVQSFYPSRNRSSLSMKDLGSQSPRSRSLELPGRRSEKSGTSMSLDRKTTRSRSPEFFCYETKKSATTVSLKPNSSIPKEGSKGPRFLRDETRKGFTVKPGKSFVGSQLKNGSSTKSWEGLAFSKESKATLRKKPENILRSTRLIRDVLNRQGQVLDTYFFGKNNTNRRKSVSREFEKKNSKNGSKEYYERKELEAGIKVNKRATTPSDGTYKLLTPEASPKSFASAGVDTEIQEITMPDQYVQRDKIPSTKVRPISSRTNVEKTYSKSLDRKSENFEKSKTEARFTYSLGKPCKRRRSILESNIFVSAGTPRKFERSKDRPRILDVGVGSKEIMRNKSKSSEDRRCDTTSSPTNESIFHASKLGAKKNIVNQESGTKREISRSGKPSSVCSRLKDKEKQPNSKETTCGTSTRKKYLLNGTALGRTSSLWAAKQRADCEAQILRSMELVRKAMRGKRLKNERSRDDPHKEKIFTKQESRKDYARTDSAGVSSRDASKPNEESLKDFLPVKIRSGIGQTGSKSSVTTTFTSNSRKNPTMKVSRITSTPCRMVPKLSKTQEIRSRKRFANARDSMEIARISMTSKSPACKRRLFTDTDFEKETEFGSSKTKNLPYFKLNSTRREISPKFAKLGSNFSKKIDKPLIIGKNSTDQADEDSSVSVKGLRSIEDIRKSIDSEPVTRVLRSRLGLSTMGNSASKSAIANTLSRLSNPQKSRVESSLKIGNRLGSRGTISLLGPQESKNLYFKPPTRFSRIVKSPSPDLASTKATETDSKWTRRSVPSSPSKSPDTAPRRPSTDLRNQEAKIRAAQARSTEAIGSRRTTSTRKSTDVVDGVVLENVLAPETKYDNDSSTAKKSDPFVIKYDEQMPGENDVGVPKKPALLRKQSVERNTSTTNLDRPTSMNSFASSDSTMQSYISRSKKPTMVKTPNTRASPSKGSTPVKGPSPGAIDGLVACKICGRHFAENRVSLHEKICKKANQKKRKQFDTMMYRVKGTDLEPFVKKGPPKKQIEIKSKGPEVKSDWRTKHEDFLATIRSARQVQAHLAAGGKLSDLPPPPPSDTSHLIPCPYCNRTFDEGAAERHIPKCKNMLHNKPPPSRQSKPRR